MGFYSRSAAGLVPATRVSYRPTSTIRRFLFHYSTGQELGVEDCAQWWRNIQRYHMQTKGWADIAYHFGVCKHGDVFEGRSLTARGAHAGDNPANHDSVGVVFLGNDDLDAIEVTDLVEGAFRYVVGTVEGSVGLYGLQQQGHRDVRSTACPGNEIYNAVHAGLFFVAAPRKETTISEPSITVAADVAAIVPGEGDGYRVILEEGSVYDFGCPHVGSGNGIVKGLVVGAIATHTGKGFTILTADGGIWNFGDARYHGRPVVTPG